MSLESHRAPVQKNVHGIHIARPCKIQDADARLGPVSLASHHAPVQKNVHGIHIAPPCKIQDADARLAWTGVPLSREPDMSPRHSEANQVKNNKVFFLFFSFYEESKSN